MATARAAPASAGHRQRILLIDGSGYVFRAYHALPPLSRSDGTPVGAVLGFANMLAKLLEESVQMAENWGQWSHLSKSGTKQLLDASTSTFFQTQLEFEQALIVAASQTADFAEGVAGFLEKRDPAFK